MLSAELALELLPEPGITTRLVPAGFVEDIFAAAISAAGGAQLDTVAREAEEAVHAKAAQLGQTSASGGCRRHDHASGGSGCEGHHRNPDGIHARTAALIVEALASLDARGS